MRRDTMSMATVELHRRRLRLEAILSQVMGMMSAGTMMVANTRCMDNHRRHRLNLLDTLNTTTIRDRTKVLGRTTCQKM